MACISAELLVASCSAVFTAQGSALQTVMVYANSKNTEIRAKLQLRSTTQGANNRLDIQSIVSFDKADGISTPVMGMPFPHDYTVLLMLLGGSMLCVKCTQCTSYIVSGDAYFEVSLSQTYFCQRSPHIC